MPKAGLRQRQRFPDVELELRELTSDRQIQELQERRLNIGFEVFDLQKVASKLNVLPMIEESLVVAMPAAHPLASQSQITVSDLATEKLILPSIDEFPFYQDFISYCDRSGFQPQIVRTVKATWLVTILSLVLAKIGIAILPSNVQNIEIFRHQISADRFRRSGDKKTCRLFWLNF